MNQSPRAIALYRNLIKYSRELELTDRDYFQNRIREAFNSSRNLPQEHIENHLTRGEELLRKRRFI